MWYLGNIIMEEYYVVFDGASMDEAGKSYLELAVGPSKDTLVLAEEIEKNVDIQEDDVEIDNPDTNPDPLPIPVPVPVPVPEEPEEESSSDELLMIILLCATLSLVVLAGLLYCVMKRNPDEP
jgi:hypothetical protein